MKAPEIGPLRRAGGSYLAMLATMLAVGSATKTQPAVQPGEPAIHLPAAPGKTVLVNVPDPRVNELQAEMADLRRKQTEPGPDPNEEYDPVGEQERLDTEFAQAERRVLEDPIDPNWSGEATRFLQAGLAERAEEAGFTVLLAECKTEVCRATLRFPDYQAAARNGSRLAARTLHGLNCAKSIRLKEPDNPAAPFDASLYLDCSKLRAGEADAL